MTRERSFHPECAHERCVPMDPRRAPVGRACHLCMLEVRADEAWVELQDETGDRPGTAGRGETDGQG